MYFPECQLFSKCRASQEHKVEGIKDGLKAQLQASGEERQGKEEIKETNEWEPYSKYCVLFHGWVSNVAWKFISLSLKPC